MATEPRHTATEYEAELRQLRDRILLMGARVEEMISASIRALVDRDDDLARRTIESDHQVNRLEVETDELCLRILARRQPVASDLRFITIALKLVTDLERIGDLAVNTCERVIDLNVDPPLKPYVDLPRMAEAAQRMVREALDAFVRGDAEHARRVVEQDREVDAYYGQVFRELVTYMMEDPRTITRATRVQAIAKYVERIADHATNIAEVVVFMVKGKDIRHMGRIESDERRAPHGVLFLCIGNAARSQMAEGLAREVLPPGVRVWSAGTRPADAVHPLAVRVMREVGVDISRQWLKRLEDVPMGDVDTVIALCGDDVGLIPGAVRTESWPLPDPAQAEGSEEERLAAFRRVRDEIRRRIAALVGGDSRGRAGQKSG